MVKTLRFSALVAEEWALVRDGLAALCTSLGASSVAEAADGEAALQLILRQRPDVALIELSVQGLFALQLVRRVQQAGVPTKVVILSSRKDRKTVIEVLRSGAQGLLLRSARRQNLADCVEQVLGGGIYVSPEIDLQQIFVSHRTEEENPLVRLSPREYQVFTLLVEGVRAKEIAARLNVSPKTIDTYRASLMRKLEIYDVAGLVKFAIQRQLIVPA